MSANAGYLLVVDDDENNRDVLSRRLVRAGHRVALASGGREALDRVEREDFDVVLLDVMMPEIDGLEVLRRIRARRDAAGLPVIMVTARTQGEDVVEALRAGASDYVSKPLDFPVVLARVHTQLALKRSVDRIVALERDLRRRNDELARANEHMRADLRAAGDVQRALLPVGAPRINGVRFHWVFRPCSELGGDFLNVFRLDDAHAGFYLLDVSGHGVPAALLSVTISRVLAPVPGLPSLVRRAADDSGGLEATPPAAVADELNRRFPMSETADRYFTLVYGVLNLRDGELRFVAAGSSGPIHVPRGGGPRDLSQTSFPIGWVPDQGYAERRLKLSRGDRLYWCSDGITEAKQPGRGMFGTGGVIAALSSGTAREDLAGSLDRIVAAAEQWGGGPARDDVSALALEFEE